MYILCPHCKFKTPAGYVLCKHCGNPLPGAAQPPAPLALATGESTLPHILMQGTTRIGRMTDNDIMIADALASRHHAIIRRDEAGRYLIEDLQSANGTYLNGTRLTAPTPLKAGDVLRIGHTILRVQAAPQPADALRPEATLVSAARTSVSMTMPRLDAGNTLVETLVPGARRGTTFRPKARKGWALKHLTDDAGNDYYILKSLDRPAYLRLTERDVFFWKLMDGKQSLRDLLVAYLQEYQALGANRLMDLLDELAEKGFLANVEPTRPPAPRGALRAFFQKEFPVQGADGIITSIYQQCAWRFYTSAGQIAPAALALTGLAAFVLIVLHGNQSLFEVQGSLALGLVVLGLANTVSIFLHEMERVMAELALLARSYGVREVFFSDDTFVVNRRRALDLCERLRDANLGIVWGRYAQADLMDEELMEAMARAGCIRLFYGIESGSNAILNQLRKGTTIEQAEEVVRLSTRYFPMLKLGFIWGLPFETMADFEATLQTVARFATLGPQIEIEMSLLTPFPSSPLYGQWGHLKEFSPSFVPMIREWVPRDGDQSKTWHEIIALIRDYPQVFAALHHVPSHNLDEKRDALDAQAWLVKVLMGLAKANSGLAAQLRENPEAGLRALRIEASPAAVWAAAEASTLLEHQTSPQFRFWRGGENHVYASRHASARTRPQRRTFCCATKNELR